MERLFSGEESLGRYLDLTIYYHQFINLKGAPKYDYMSYLDQVDVFDKIPMAYKGTEYET